MDEYLERKYNVSIAAYDVSPPGSNVFSYGQQSRVPIHVFNGSHVPMEADRSADAVLFGAVLHHAARHAPTLLAEARRISKRWILVFEDVTVKGERNPRERYIHMRHANHGVPENDGATVRGIFRSQAEWIHLMQAGGGWAVTRIGAIIARNVTHEYRRHHRLAKLWSGAELTGPTYQRYFIAERCVQSSAGRRSWVSGSASNL